MGLNYASRSISAIGKSANVKVHTYESGRVKFASAHDLRRSFGDRWATRVMPPVLQQLMRHESIETTMKYYVGRSVDQTASILWEAHNKVVGNTLGNSEPSSTDSADRSIDANS
jgi:integrase